MALYSPICIAPVEKGFWRCKVGRWTGLLMGFMSHYAPRPATLSREDAVRGLGWVAEP